MILSVLCIYHCYAFTPYHWFWSIGSLEKVDLTVFRVNGAWRTRGAQTMLAEAVTLHDRETLSHAEKRDGTD